MPVWIDTHAHLNDDEKFGDDLPAVLAAAAAAGVAQIVVVGIDAASSRRAVALAEAHEQLFAVVGIQPNYVTQQSPGDWDAILELAEHPKAVAVGETGLDRHWDYAPIDDQRAWFLRHLDLAAETGKPVVIHNREAEDDIVAVFEQFRSRTQNRPITGVMHSYCGTPEAAARCVEFGLHVSFAGMLTFKKNDDLRTLAAGIPTDRLLVETDAPYLSPEPVRGRRNVPTHVVHTGACLAGLHDRAADEMAAITTANARRLFGLPETAA